MPQPIIKIDLDRINDWDSFHDVFTAEFGFPEFYGRNLNAWIDCMTSLDSPGDGMTRAHAPAENVLVLQLEHVGAFIHRCPDIYSAIIECCAFVNYRRLEVGEPAVLALSFQRTDSSV